LSSAFPIIGSTNILYNRTIGIGHFPNFPLGNSGKGTDKIVNVHLSNSLSLLLNYTIFIGKSQAPPLENSQIFPKSLSRKSLGQEKIF
jgi:hypothetical protein